MLSATDERRWAPSLKNSLKPWKRACTALLGKPSAGSAWWLPLCVTHPRSTSFLLYLGGLRVFPLHSRSNLKGQLLLAFEIHQRIFNYCCCLVCQMIQKPTKPSPSLRTSPPDAKINLYFFHFKTLVDCGYRSLSGRAVKFFFSPFFLSTIHMRGLAEQKSGANPPRVCAWVWVWEGAWRSPDPLFLIRWLTGTLPPLRVESSHVERRKNM